jgi:hypothetical protein
MNETLKTFLSGLVMIGLATAVLLPGRQTPAVIKAFGGVLTGGLRTSITGK